MTCGSVDDGKSTLIGHLLYDAKMLFADQERALELESMSSNAHGERDYSLLLDGLSAEREQGITIDVAYRYFATEKRSFIVADTPGHEEYTRNMAVAASESEFAVMLIDAVRGVRVQTKRHLRICRMMGIKDYVFAVNKMDAAGYREKVFRKIEVELGLLTSGMTDARFTAIPLSALKGDNVAERSLNMPWYSGPSLLEYLEDVESEGADEEGFVMPVQRVNRFDGKRGLQGNVAAGAICRGEEIVVYPGEARATVASVNVSGEDADEAVKGQSVTLTLSEDIDISRGYVLTRGTELKCTDMLEADILWMDETALTEGRTYMLKLASQNVNVSVMKIKYGIDPDSGEHVALRRIEKNGLACVDLNCHEDMVFDAFDRHQAMGRFILIDKVTGSTAGCGTVKFALRRAENLKRQEHDITREARAEALGQRPMTVWFTGLSGSGKSVLANELEKIIASRGMHTMLLDGDNVRLGINRDLGFNDYDRTENIRRLAEISKLFNDAGIIVITALISPFEEDRETARRIIGTDSFAEIYVSTPLEECERRDKKGLYKKARNGEIPNFTGIGSPYEVPKNPDIEIDTTEGDAAEMAERLFGELEERFRLK